MKGLVLSILIFLSASVGAQSDMKIDGTLLDFFQWGDNYVCDVMTSPISFSKRAVAMYSKSGQLLWQTEIEVEGGLGDFVVSKDAEYAYLINYSNTAYSYNKYDQKLDLLTIFQFDKSGKAKEIHLSYANSFAPHLGTENLAVEYLAGYSEGLVGVVSNCGGEEVYWNKKYALFTLNISGEIKVVNLENDLSYKEWLGLSKSNLNYHQVDDKLIVSQLQTGTGSLNIALSVFNLINGEKLSEVENKVFLDPNRRYGKTYETAFAPEGIANLSEHVCGAYSSSTLGSLFNYQVYQGRLFFVGNYFEAKGNFVALSELVGFFYFEVDLRSDNEIMADEIRYVDFDQSFGDLEGYTVMIENDDVFVCCDYSKGMYFFENGVNKGKIEMEFESSASLGLACARSKSLVNNVSLMDVKYTLYGVYHNESSFNVYEKISPKSMRVYQVDLSKE
jgi:hypothetical protein